MAFQKIPENAHMKILEKMRPEEYQYINLSRHRKIVYFRAGCRP